MGKEFAFAWLHTLLAVDTYVVRISSNPPTSGNERSKKLIEGILWSRWFVNWYHVAIGWVILIFTVRHWTTTWTRRKRARALEGRAGEARIVTPQEGDHQNQPKYQANWSSSSSSSTLRDEPPPPGEFSNSDYVHPERTPLLPINANHSAERPLGNLYCTAKATLMYQPCPIPLINKELPSNSLTMLVLTLLGINIFFAFYRAPLSINYIFIAADRFGLMFVVNLPWLYILAAKNQPIKWLTGYSYESLNILHRRLGEWLCLLGILHFVGMLVVWYTVLRPVNITFLRFIVIPVVYLGLFTLLCYELLYFTSIRSFRQRFYELFLGFHITLQVAALAFLYFHFHTSRPYVLASLGIFLVDRLVFRLYANTIMVPATLFVQPDKSTIILNATVPQNNTSLGKLDSNLSAGQWPPGSHLFLTIPSLSSSGIFQAHPFSIFTSPPSSSVSLLIRAHTGFSRNLLHHAHSDLSQVSVRLDGPYGSTLAISLLESSDLSILVAGGSGIALTYPLASHLCVRNRRESDIENVPFRDAGRRKVLFVWVYRSAAHLSWLLRNSAGVDVNLIEQLRGNGVEVLLLGPTACSDSRPDVPKIIEAWLDSNERMYSNPKRRSNVGVVVCGPQGMTRDVRNGCAGLVRKGWNVGIEVERFEW
ncbi:MAG: hypothetical protein Q9227_001714 [Pyrenula ochraceoflavens]